MIENKKGNEKINIDLKSQLVHFDINRKSSILYYLNNTDKNEKLFLTFLDNENEELEFSNKR